MPISILGHRIYPDGVDAQDAIRPLLPRPAEVDDRLRALERRSFAELLEEARALRDIAHSRTISYSPKVFIPLTRLCRDACGYCTFSRPPSRGEPPFMTPDEALAIARAGAAAGCSEALFTIGDRPEARYRTAREALDAMGHSSTADYLAHVAGLVLRETGLLPHINAGLMTRDEFARLRAVSASQGLMLEGVSPSLMERGGPHFRTHTKSPSIRIDAIALAGELAIPFTTGILVGLGETRRDRVESLLVIKALHERYGHIQEVIVQNFQPKPGTRMAQASAPSFDDLLWTAAATRLILGAEMNIQVPPNLSFERFPELLAAGINDWGGVSPVTPDHVNPEARWPAIDRLRRATEAAGFALAARLPVYPAVLSARDHWLDPALHAPVLQASDADGWARADAWSPGIIGAPQRPPRALAMTASLDHTLSRATRGERLDEDAIATLFAARGAEFDAVIDAADALRAKVCGDSVRYVVNRNVNYTNVCGYRCSFCAFSKGKTADHLRGRPYDLDLEEVSRRVAEAWERGATEVCMQGGIHPNYTGQTYLDLLAAAKRSAPAIHVHAFSPLEVTHGASTLGIPVDRFLRMLRDAGLGSLPGTAAEILDDEARAILCPDKLSTAEWFHVVGAAHQVRLRTTSTIMFGHIDTHRQWARHLLAIRDLQEKHGGFTEFVPLPFVHMEAPLYLKGRARRGPTSRETLLMHAVARLALHPLITNIQTSWVKLGGEGLIAALQAGASDVGGTLMNESISRSAGTQHGQELPPTEMDALIRRADRIPSQRTTLYASPPAEQMRKSYEAAPLTPTVTQWLADAHKTSRERAMTTA